MTVAYGALPSSGKKSPMAAKGLRKYSLFYPLSKPIYDYQFLFLPGYLRAFISVSSSLQDITAMSMISEISLKTTSAVLLSTFTPML